MPYDTLCRRSELEALRVEDLSELESGAMSILVRRAKNDPFGDGQLGYLTPKTIKLLKKWLRFSKIKDGWLAGYFHAGVALPNVLSVDRGHSARRVLQAHALSRRLQKFLISNPNSDFKGAGITAIWQVAYFCSYHYTP